MIGSYKRIKEKLKCTLCKTQLEPFGDIAFPNAMYWLCPKCDKVFNLILSLKEVKT
jgi:hypothetical protein